MNGPQWPFREIWLVDFEFIARSGNRPKPVCLVALELRSRRIIRQWRVFHDDEPVFGHCRGILLKLELLAIGLRADLLAHPRRCLFL